VSLHKLAYFNGYIWFVFVVLLFCYIVMTFFIGLLVEVCNFFYQVTTLLQQEKSGSSLKWLQTKYRNGETVTEKSS